MKKRFITEEDIAKAIKLHADGYEWRIVGARLGFTTSAIYNAVKRWKELNDPRA